jgi:hypothetical protein
VIILYKKSNPINNLSKKDLINHFFNFILNKNFIYLLLAKMSKLLVFNVMTEV